MRPSSALRWASTREYSRRSLARSGQIAATTWSRCARRTAGGTLQELQAVRLEDAQERPELDVQQALDGRAVGGHALGRAGAVGPGAVADAQLVLLRAVAAAHDDPCGLRAEAHQLALVAGARRAPVQPK